MTRGEAEQQTMAEDVVDKEKKTKKNRRSSRRSNRNSSSVSGIYFYFFCKFKLWRDLIQQCFFFLLLHY